MQVKPQEVSADKATTQDQYQRRNATCYKSKFERLVEHAKRQDKVIADMRYDENIRRFYDDGAVWFWAGDDSDNLETLACPVVINAGDLRALIAAAPTALVSEPAGTRFAATVKDAKATALEVFTGSHDDAKQAIEYMAALLEVSDLAKQGGAA